ncbi:MAG: ribosome maturation factor RimM [SAR324 cluster bacterium]|nr:ribosome maturation factor RimM [SAR324 cluster bacterium]
MTALLDRDRLTQVGTITGSHGVRGGLKAIPETDTPEYYVSSRAVYVDSEEGLRRFAVASWQEAGGRWIISLEGLVSREEADRLKGGLLLLDEASLRPLATDEFFRHDLIGCAVVDESGAQLGRVAELIIGTAQDVLLVREGRREILLPLVREVVAEVDLQRRTIRVTPPPGLLELND